MVHLMLTVDSALSIVFENSFNIGLENQGKVGNFGFIIAFRSVSFLSLFFLDRQVKLLEDPQNLFSLSGWPVVVYYI